MEGVKNASNLLILMEILEIEKTIGAHITVPIKGPGIVNDSSAYIFSVDHCRKFKAKKPKCI